MRLKICFETKWRWRMFQNINKDLDCSLSGAIDLCPPNSKLVFQHFIFVFQSENDENGFSNKRHLSNITDLFYSIAIAKHFHYNQSFLAKFVYHLCICLISPILLNVIPYSIWLLIVIICLFAHNNNNLKLFVWILNSILMFNNNYVCLSLSLFVLYLLFVWWGLCICLFH